MTPEEAQHLYDLAQQWASAEIGVVTSAAYSDDESLGEYNEDAEHFHNAFREALGLAPIDTAAELKKIFEEAGFEDVGMAIFPFAPQYEDDTPTAEITPLSDEEFDAEIRRLLDEEKG